MTNIGKQIIAEACEIILGCIKEKDPDTNAIREQLALIRRENVRGGITNATK